ncbi:protein of unknown function (Leucine rich repeat domain) [endosymbiont DhMRE of Dentiscutata heterogama]|uniref:leucine-rich repeat domain-containing protein n=1 Tax=endosymbiont DhMRE of Dentiscutata heterogama TaxID=1609546 RepID=UPI000633E625|nr:leucine-rich repeat domain-containing protein [endosymbiont DhMRE of Dentiscutata heterogama]CFW92729.1 protein of unknown function (Leucine rich repeat domain) [endosymbiont DhMRE of Dentiscutata heterogama]
MPHAQTWLETEYNTQQKRTQTIELKIGSNFLGQELIGSLNLNDFTNLKKLYCYNNKLTTLVLTNCIQLEELYCYHNQLTNLSLPKHCPNLTKLYCANNQLTNLNFSILNPKKLQHLNISNNNFSPSDLSIFSSFTNLEILKIGNDNTKKIKQNIYNRFHGSLEPLRNLIKLRELHISNTDLNEVDIEHLPQSLEKIEYSTDKRSDCKLRWIVPQLHQHQEFLSKYPTAKVNQARTANFLPKSDSKKINQPLAKHMAPEPERINLNYSTKKNNEELLKEITAANNLAKETFWQQTISGLEKQINLFSQEENIEPKIISLAWQKLTAIKSKAIQELNIENYLQEISQLQKDFTKLQTNLTQLYELQKELSQLQVEQQIESLPK